MASDGNTEKGATVNDAPGDYAAQAEVGRTGGKSDVTRTERMAIAGWRQSLSIIRKLHAGLQFALSEIEAESKRNVRAFGTDSAKAQQFHAAQTAMNLGTDYLAAMDRERPLSHDN